jgi:hypothetical protein
VPLRDPCVRKWPIGHLSLAAAWRAHTGARRHRRRSFHRPIHWAVVLCLLCPLGASAREAEPVSKQQMQGLDEQVQEIKSDVLAIAAELGRLEEKLLYPSNTQVALFVAVSEGEGLRLDSVQVRIDGELVAHHIYSFKELEALQKGGVQRIYTGNLRTGEHQLDVSVAGKRSDGGDFGGSQSFRFEKEVDPKLVEITLAGAEAGAASIQVEGW